MKKSNKPQNSAENENHVKVQETFKDQKGNIAVKQALKKENQPTSPEDLSELHNTSEIGTSGGDQRASDMETNVAN